MRLITLNQIRNIFYLSLILFPLSSFAQKAQLRSTVIDRATSQPIVSASAALLDQENQTYVQGAQTDENGQLSFQNLDAGTYTLRITFIGYINYLEENIVLTDKLETLPTIAMDEDGQLLEEVVVEGRLPEMQLGIDKKVFDVSQSMVSVGGSASDLLDNVPTLQVDADGGVSLRGSSSVRILIDGKESAMAGSDVNALLQALPANIIDKVELITNPSAKYDAEGQSGIINIVLKKNVRTGLNGSINTSAGSFNNYMAGITLNYRDRKVNYSGSYNFNRRNNEGSSFNDNTRYVDDRDDPSNPRTISDALNNRLMYGHTVRLGVDFYVSDKTNISLGSNLSFRDNTRQSDISYNYFNIPAYGNNSVRRSGQTEDDFGVDLTLDVSHELKREGEEISANVSYGSDKEDGANDYFQTYGGARADLLRNNLSTERGQNWNFQLDYILPLGENHKFEAGYRSILRNSEDSQLSELQDTITHIFNPDYNVSNDFDLSSGVHALYVNYQQMLSQKVGMQVGLRGEQANLNSTYYSLDPSVPESDRATQAKLDYFRLYPSVYLTYEVGEVGDKVQLSYSRRVQRPRGWQVNPFLNMSDETNFRQGNPNLMPEDIHAFELSYAKFYDNWNFISSAYYRRVNDMTRPFMHSPSLIGDIISDTTNVTYSRWENVASQNVVGLELISKVTFVNWWDATLNANLFYNNTKPYSDFDTDEVDNLAWNANLTSNVRFAPGWSAQVRGNYRAPMNSLQGKMHSMYGMDVAVKKDVLKGKGSIMLNVRDAFDTRKFRMENYLPSNYIYMENRWMPRMFTLSLSYRFGVQDLSKRRNEERPPMDDMGGEEF